MATAKMKFDWSRTSVLAWLAHNANFSPAKPLSSFNPYAEELDKDLPEVLRLTAKEAAEMNFEEIFKNG